MVSAAMTVGRRPDRLSLRGGPVKAHPVVGLAGRRMASGIGSGRPERHHPRGRSGHAGSRIVRRRAAPASGTDSAEDDERDHEDDDEVERGKVTHGREP